MFKHEGFLTMALPANRGWAAADYLAFERASELRHELINAEIYAMTGASLEHTTISANLVGLLGNHFRGKPCRTLASDMRVKVNAANYCYPDVVVVCGTPELEDNHGDTLLNPMVVFEILSPSTERYDRGEKFQRYRAISSLQVYILVSQESPRLEMFTRHDSDGTWVLSEATALSESVYIPVIDCTLPLSEVYERVF